MTRALSQLDAFFVAYQERADISMQLGVEIEIVGTLTRAAIERGLEHIVGRWPQLGQRARSRIFGLAWRGRPDPGTMLTVGGDLAGWRNRRIDPFTEPPFQVMWLEGSGRSVLSLRAHHAVCDGQSFMAVGAAMVEVIVGGPGASRLEAQENPFALRALWRADKLRPMWRQMRDLVRESKSDGSARLATRSVEPGPIAVAERVIEVEAVTRLARDAGVSPALWLCASWMRAIGSWNASRGQPDTRRVSIEMPVSSRTTGKAAVGNFISPIVLFGDASEPTGVVAAGLRKQFRRAIADRAHLAMPLFTAPGRYVPWWLFRRVAANNSFSGFATSHFAWLDAGITIREAVSAHSGGTMSMPWTRVYTPVCRHMGAALSVVPWPDGLQLNLTHRVAAVSTSDASALLERVGLVALGRNEQPSIGDAP